MSEGTWRTIDELVAIAGDRGHTPAQVALNWLLRKPGVTAPIIGARTVEQLEQNLGAVGWSLDAEEMARLDAVSALPLPIARYDILLLACLGMQLLMLVTGLETRDELKVITHFHLLGLGLELFKVNVSASWSYPETAVLKAWGVPLYSGFMYASVASYMIQAWRSFDLLFLHWPRAHLVVPRGVARHAARAGIPAHRRLRLVRREHRDLLRGLAVPRSA